MGVYDASVGGHQKDEKIQYFISAAQINLITCKWKRCIDAFLLLFLLFFFWIFFQTVVFFLSLGNKKEQNKVHLANGRITTENSFYTK